ncbi:hypothetical protein LIER_10830 [Lithospermum erythrorhizon]|uniref:Reverse transcriptase domain-containing protein n=1 Tax=Lithospermum erythrorhizon TaxID=34254 RepID=A0AAV3PL18_LITER
MLYVESVTYSLLINGEQVGYIKPGRGLRHDDLLSPYLFIVCTEGLISLLKGVCARGELYGLRMGNGLKPLSHLMFADDILLLSKASVEEAHTIKRILCLYEQWSRQRVSVQKSTIVFSPNVDVQGYYHRDPQYAGSFHPWQVPRYIYILSRILEP